MAASAPLLELRDVVAGYGEIEVLRGVSLDVHEGEIVSVIGANGAGKSTLLKTIFGLVRPVRGTIRFRGEGITHVPPTELLRRRISYVPEGRANFPAMSVQENLEMAAFIRRDRAAVAREIDALCARFPILATKRRTPVGNLSGGQQQMVEIAMALMLRPELMLIDEPTIGLAPILVREVFGVIQEINAAGTTVVLVEQNARRALEISDVGFVLELGTVPLSGPARELADNQEVYRAYLGER